MGKKPLFSFIIFFIIFLGVTDSAQAVENPLSQPNNKIGIHILFDHELKPASELINSANGDWGYATIVIQAGDKDLAKWQSFMDECKKHHVIPIVRLATEGDYFNTKVWRRPTDTDIIDFANFLDSLDWPVKNRYIIVYNEVNRGDEWGGEVDPGGYAQILSYATTVFKSKSPDYFIIPAGLDNAAPNQPNMYMNQYNYMLLMHASVPGIFNQVDGLSSHSYPNPGFRQAPTTNTPTSINSFQYERALVKTFTNKELPIFITETGWSTEEISENTVADYYISALNTVWKDPGIVTVTPFLLQGRGGPFQKFSFFGVNGTLTEKYNKLKSFPKVKGTPVLPKVLAVTTIRNNPDKPDASIRDFSDYEVVEKSSTTQELKIIFKWLLKI